MNITTQISGNIHPHSAALHALKDMLTQLGINVAHPAQDESLLYKTDPNTAWQRYNTQLSFYESIADSAFHILYNDEKISDDVSKEVLYAMLKNRPILMTGKPVFASNVSAFTRELITKHMHQFHSINLPDLELTELSSLLSRIKPVEYELLGSEKVLVKSRIKMHFRKLLDQAKND